MLGGVSQINFLEMDLRRCALEKCRVSWLEWSVSNSAQISQMLVDVVQLFLALHESFSLFDHPVHCHLLVVPDLLQYTLAVT